MDRRLGRLAAIGGTAAMALLLAGNVAAAGPAKLTAVVATDSTGAPASGMAGIRVLHASPDAPAVDVYLDGTKAITGLAFGQMAPALSTGGYIDVAAGDHAVKVCATGSTTVCPIDVPKLTLADGHKYTIAATGPLASITPQVVDDTATTQATDTAQVRVYHFSSDTPAVDVVTTDTPPAKLVSNLAYPNASDYLKPAAGTITVKVCAAPGDTVCPLGPLPLTVANGTTYSVFAIGSLEALLATPAPTATNAPMATQPPTDTIGTASGTDGSGPAVGLVALALAATAAFAVSLPLVARRNRR
jgi:hypothetical protein